MVAHKIVPHEEGICACDVAGHELVAFLAPEFGQRLETRAEVVCTAPFMTRLIFLRYGDRWRKLSVVFDDHHRRRHAADGLPNPEIIAIDVDGQQSVIAESQLEVKHLMNLEEFRDTESTKH